MFWTDESQIQMQKLYDSAASSYINSEQEGRKAEPESLRLSQRNHCDEAAAETNVTTGFEEIQQQALRKYNNVRLRKYSRGLWDKCRVDGWKEGVGGLGGCYVAGSCLTSTTLAHSKQTQTSLMQSRYVLESKSKQNKIQKSKIMHQKQYTMTQGV